MFSLTGNIQKDKLDCVRDSAVKCISESEEKSKFWLKLSRKPPKTLKYLFIYLFATRANLQKCLSFQIIAKLFPLISTPWTITTPKKPLRSSPPVSSVEEVSYLPVSHGPKVQVGRNKEIPFLHFDDLTPGDPDSFRVCWTSCSGKDKTNRRVEEDNLYRCFVTSHDWSRTPWRFQQELSNLKQRGGRLRPAVTQAKRDGFLLKNALGATGTIFRMFSEKSQAALL